MVVSLVLIGLEPEWESLSFELVNERKGWFFHTMKALWSSWHHRGLFSLSCLSEPGSPNSWVLVEKAAAAAALIDRVHVTVCSYLFEVSSTWIVAPISQRRKLGRAWGCNDSPLAKPRKWWNLNDILIPHSPLSSSNNLFVNIFPISSCALKRKIHWSGNLESEKPFWLLQLTVWPWAAPLTLTLIFSLRVFICKS